MTEESTFQEELEELVTKHAHTLIPGIQLPMLADYVCVIAVDDAVASGGGIFVNARRGSAYYRNVGLLTHAINVMDCDHDEVDDDP